MTERAPVVVGTDLSEVSKEAVEQAAAWAGRLGSPLVVVHVSPPRVLERMELSGIERALREDLGKRLTADTRVVVSGGSAHAELMNVAENEGASLLVVGASGAGAFERTFFGTTADQVVRHAHCPVLVARKSPVDGPVLCATDFSDRAAPAVAAAAQEAHRRGTPLVLLHSIYETPSPLSALGPIVISVPAPAEQEIDAMHQAADETLQTLLERFGVIGDRVVTRKAPAMATLEEAGRRQASLVVVGTHGRTGLSRMALGSVAASIVQKAPCSVLALRLAEDG